MFRSVLTVCVGNICRSPMAEGLFLSQCRASGRDVRVESAGIGALVGHPADPSAIDLMLERDIDISGHRARQLTFDVMRGFDLVLVMESRHRERIEQLSPLTRGRVFTLGHWDQFEIPDPYRRPRAAFEEALRLIDQGVTSWMRYLQ